MLKAAIEKIEAMSRPSIHEIMGHNYLIGKEGYEEIRPIVDVPICAELYSLDAVVKMVRTEAIPRYAGETLYINIPNHLRVDVFSQPRPEAYEIRPLLYTAKATDVPGWEPETKLAFERAAIALQTRFQDSEDRAYTLQLLSQITTGAKVTYNDIGVATTIVTQKGISLQQNTTIKPIVRLRPYRTFQELEQPEGLFLIRIDERGISFIEADGGMWKLKARETIKAYLEEHLAEEIENGSVVVML